MAYASLEEFVRHIERMGELKRIRYPADPHLEITEIADRVMKAGGRALLGVATTAPPRRVKEGPCKEVVERDRPSLDFLPIQTCWPEDGGPFITLPLVISRHPQTGRRNVGMYRMQKYDSRSTGMHWQLHKVGAEHQRVAKEPFPVAVCLGGDPVFTYAATAPLPPEIDELLFAGWLRGKPVELVKCETSDLEVPSCADVVL